MDKRLTILVLLAMVFSASADIIILKPNVDQSQDVFYPKIALTVILRGLVSLG